ncbi:MULTISPECIES: DctP family TRAP transporter solute-binding subunit [unclassified Rhizobium]|uniref:DctP family TRAP transporter solute-binding subunit n=1 Tax=unclassified Rhizobium TaxID=2613769 RepID=UPI001ADC410C|nr:MULTISPECIES: DctP family TRAP transporter solute-binding subunit [unclassified Rhizobium]MBO9127910.1 DctP family TRAP transporter solute-binding subunit [Rhizobium sp. 16-488-2b]MBO9178304.1 DctP family TRAP transporter solute-binding subunit [Rhizobium sp. 16-488-2a]
MFIDRKIGRLKAGLIVSAMGAAMLALPTASQAEIREMRLRAGTSQSDQHPDFLGFKKFAEIVSEKSGGKIKITVAPGATLGTDVQMQANLQAGTQDFMTTSPVTMAGQIPQVSILDLPFVFKSSEEYDKLMDGAVGAKFNELMAEKGWIGLGFTNNGFRETTSKIKAITKWEDFQGLKIRAIQNPMYLELFKTLGANPTPLPVSEIYTALETGTVEAQENPLPQIVFMRLFEVQKFLSLTNHSLNSVVLLMGKPSWNKLNDDEKKLISDAAREVTLYKRDLVKTKTADWLKTVQEAGVAVNEITPEERQRFADKTKPVVEKFSAELGKDFSDMYFAELKKIQVGSN